MYKARIETDRGQIFRFGPDNCIVFDIDPLSGVDVDIATSQGFQQIGETVENQSVRGLSRTITGTIFKNSLETAQMMLRYLPIFTTGKLYYNDDYYCNIVVSKTPYIKVDEKQRKFTFTMMVYCNVPYWLDANRSDYVIGGYSKAFKFPVIYDTHTFGVKNPSAFINCYNAGVIDVPYELQFTCITPVENPGIINVYTLQKLKFNLTLGIGEILTIRRENGILYVELDQSGTKSSVLSKLTEDSDLFWINPGDNVLRLTADSNEDDLIGTISFNAAEIGVI